MKTKHFKLFFYSLLFINLLLTNSCECPACKCETETDVILLKPVQNELIEIGTDYTIEVYVVDLYNSLDKLDVYLKQGSDTTMLTSFQGVAGKALYKWEWNTTEMLPGDYTIEAKAFFPDTRSASHSIVLAVNAPNVTTIDATEITHSSATSGGVIVYDGSDNIVVRGVVWSSENQSPSLSDNDGFTEDGDGTGSYLSHLTDLKEETTYYLKAYATTNSSGTVYGDVKTFETLKAPDAGLPAVRSDEPSEITAHTVRCGGIITDDGGEPGNITAGVVWNKTGNPTIENNDGIYTVPDKLSTDDTFKALLTALKENTPYFFRAYASNSAGTVYGEELSIETGLFNVYEGTFTDSRDGKQYKTVTIFGQTWMAENLAYLPEVCGPDGNCGYWVYGYDGTDVDEAKATSNYTVFGVLYDWEKAKTACPSGWHLPTSDEWSTLEMYLGMDYETANDFRNRGDNDEGGMLKETGTLRWKSPNTGADNAARFNARPGGYRDGFGPSTFKKLTEECHFWTKTITPGDKLYISRYLKYDSDDIFAKTVGLKSHGYSVRCVKD